MPRFKIEGTVEEGYEPVKEHFKKIYEQGREDNSQLCAYVDGRKVVDLWGVSKGDYGPDLLHIVYSSTKSLAAIAIACMVDKGLLDYGEKVVTYWPEFGKNDKDKLKLEDVLRHEAGMSWFNHSFDEEDFLPENIKKNALGKVAEEEILRYPPESLGTKREYHAFTRGLILNEIFRRVEPKGRTIGEYLREEISLLLEADAYIGVEEKCLDRFQSLRSFGVGTVLLNVVLPWSKKVETTPSDLYQGMKLMKRMGAREGEPKRPPIIKDWPEKMPPNKFSQAYNSKVLRMGEMPSVNGACTARGLARIAACMAQEGELDGVKIMSKETVRKMHDNRITGQDAGVLGIITDMTQGGVAWIRSTDKDNQATKKFKMHREGYAGWMGFGGSVFQWHPEMKIGFGYVPSRLSWHDFGNVKGAELQGKVLECAKKIKG